MSRQPPSRQPTLTAAVFLAAVEAYGSEDRERMRRRPAGKTRSQWRYDNPTSSPFPEYLFGTGRGRVVASPDYGYAKSTDIWIWAGYENAKGNCICRGHIDLNHPKADATLNALRAARSVDDVTNAIRLSSNFYRHQEEAAS